MIKLCTGCRHITDIAFTDELDRSYCIQCAASQPAAREYLLATWAANNIPYQVGDKVACRTGGTVYDGVGSIEEVSTDPKDLASPLVPMFRVAITERAYPEVPDSIWYSEVCLSKVDA